MIRPAVLLLLIGITTVTVHAQTSDTLPPSRVDYEGFMAMTDEVQAYRQERLIDLNEFLELMHQEGTIVLDTRSAAAYNRKHITGAMHLNFSDFTAGKLAKVIPSKDTRVLIYCNNNIEGDEVDFAAKAMPLALNIPTFINLYGYGYQNIYELSSLVAIDDPRLEFEGTAVE